MRIIIDYIGLIDISPDFFSYLCCLSGKGWIQKQLFNIQMSGGFSSNFITLLFHAYQKLEISRTSFTMYAPPGTGLTKSRGVKNILSAENDGLSWERVSYLFWFIIKKSFWDVDNTKISFLPYPLNVSEWKLSIFLGRKNAFQISFTLYFHLSLQ